jgi:hypothetical protein
MLPGAADILLAVDLGMTPIKDNNSFYIGSATHFDCPLKVCFPNSNIQQFLLLQVCNKVSVNN